MTSLRRWSIVMLLSLGMMIAYVDRANLSAAIADPSFIKHFQLSNVDRGNLNSSFFWTYALLQIPAGFLVDRYGVKMPYAIAFLGWSLTSAVTAFAGGLTQLFGLRMLLGVGESVVTPASLRWIRFNVDEKQRGLAVGLYMAGTKIGPAIGVPLAALLIQYYDWQKMFLILGIGCLIWLIPWMLMVKDDDRQIEASQNKNAGPGLEFWAIMRSPLMWGVIIGTFCYNYFVYYSMTWLPAYLREQRHLSVSDMSWVTMASFAGMATMSTVAGAVADKLIRDGRDAVKIRKAFTLAGFAVASTEIFGAMSSSTTVAIVFAVISLTGLGLTTANYWALTQTMLPGAAIGRIAGVQNFASNFSGVVAPILTGWLLQMTGSYQAPMQAIWFFLISGIASYVFLVRAKYAPQPQRG